MARFFTGHGGVRLAAELYGNPDHPGVLLLGAGTPDTGALAGVLAAAGRHVVRLDPRGSGDGETAQAEIGDLRAVLAQLDTRPVLVGMAAHGWIAAAALGEGGAHLATGLVLIDPPSQTTAGALGFAASEHVAVPTLVVRSDGTAEGLAFARRVADGEMVEMEGGGDPGEILGAVLLDFLERRAPRVPPEYRAGSDPRTLRDALGCFATGVTVVTTLDADGRPVGLTANSFTSVSLEPPLLLVCIAREAGSLPALMQHEHFGVNVLHIGQQPVSIRFAEPAEDRFAATPWEFWTGNVPLLRHALASFECARHGVHDGGDHVIVVGRVVRVRFEPWRDPLLYFRGKYRRLHFS